MDNKLIGLILATAVGVIMVGTLLAPTIVGIQQNIGDEVEYTNTALNSYRLAESDESVTIGLVYDSDDTNWTITINGTSTTTEDDSANANICYSDALTITKSANGSSMIVYYNGLENTNTYTKSITFADGTVTYVENDSTVYTADYTWLYVLDDDGDYVNMYGSTAIYVNSINDIIMSGSYVSGDNDTYYDVIDGTVTLSADYTSALDYDIELVDGTTDVYTVTNIVLTVGDETFTPYRVLVAETITGHESSGADYSILGIVPVVMILALMMMVIPYITKRDE